MSVHLYMSVHVRRAVTAGLRLRGVDVLTAQEDGNRELLRPRTARPGNRVRPRALHPE